jgi:hypothetical protein
MAMDDANASGDPWISVEKECVLWPYKKEKKKHRSD